MISLKPILCRAATVAIAILIAASSSMAAKRALVIGISDYATQPDLGGPKNDVRIMTDILDGWYGFDRGSTVVLTDRKATKDSIESEFKRLRNCAPDDVVAIYYSGHGTMTCRGRILEEALVPYDGNPDKRDTLVTISELRSWLQRVPAKQVDVILDCCYSGGFTKDTEGSTQLKCVFPSTQLPDSMEVLEKTLVVSRPGHSVISASQTGRDVPDTEFPLVDGTRIRASALAFLMYRNVYLSPSLTHSQMVDGVRRLMRQWHINQQPGFGGILGDKRVFGGPAPSMSPGCIPVGKRDGRSVELMGGTALGVTKGTRIECLDSRGKKIATADVVRADWIRSRVQMRTSSSRASVARLTKAHK